MFSSARLRARNAHGRREGLIPWVCDLLPSRILSAINFNIDGVVCAGYDGNGPLQAASCLQVSSKVLE